KRGEEQDRRTRRLPPHRISPLPHLRGRAGVGARQAAGPLKPAPPPPPPPPPGGGRGKAPPPPPPPATPPPPPRRGGGGWRPRRRATAAAPPSLPPRAGRGAGWSRPSLPPAPHQPAPPLAGGRNSEAYRLARNAREGRNTTSVAYARSSHPEYRITRPATGSTASTSKR